MNRGMAKRILLGCGDVPGWGGASTIAYDLFECLRCDGFNVAFVNLVHASDEPRIRAAFGAEIGNPRRLNSVHTLSLSDPEWRSQPALVELIERLQPDWLFGFGFVGAWQLSRAAPHLPLLFRTSGSSQIGRLLREGMIADFIGFKEQIRRGVRFPMRTIDPERDVTQHARLIFVHSPLVRFAFEVFFPAHVGKLYERDISIADLKLAEAGPYQGLRRPFDERDIDVLFVANDWSRLVKNLPLTLHLVRRLQHLRVHLVGAIDDHDIPAVCHGLMPRRHDLYALYGRSRVLVCPSLQDAAPGVLFEAAAMGCNIVTSANCGNWQLCHPELLAESCRERPFLEAIRRGLAKPYPTDPTDYLGGYAELVETLRVLI